MQFTDKQFKHDNSIALSFRNPISHEACEVAELAEDVCDETFGLKFQDTLAFLVQDLAASSVSKELEVNKVECDVHQGDKVGVSAVGELIRTVNKINFIFFILGAF